MIQAIGRKRERTKEKGNLKFRREEAERNRQHELQLTKVYMQMLGMPHQQPPINFGQFQGMSSQQQIALTVTPTAVNTPVQQSNSLSNQGTSNFNLWGPYVEHEQSIKAFTLLHDFILIFTTISIVLNRFIKITAFLNAISSIECCSHVLIFNPNPASVRGDTYLREYLFAITALYCNWSLTLHLSQSSKIYLPQYNNDTYIMFKISLREVAPYI